jgi:hypothetical protein
MGLASEVNRRCRRALTVMNRLEHHRMQAPVTAAAMQSLPVKGQRPLTAGIYLWLFAVIVMWASNTVVVKIALQDLPPFWAAFLRFGPALPFLAAFIWFQGDGFRLRGRQWAQVFKHIDVGVYQLRNPQGSDYYRCVEDHFEQLELCWQDRYASHYGFWRPYVTDVIYRYLDCGDLHLGFARVR